MPLSMQDYAAVIEALRLKAAESFVGAERRTTQRMLVQAPMDILPLSGQRAGDVVKVLTVDISPESLGILCSHPMDSKQTFLAMLPRRKSNAIVALYSAMRLTAVADGVYSIGAALKAEQPKDVLESLASVNNPKIEPLRQALRKLCGTK